MNTMMPKSILIGILFPVTITAGLLPSIDKVSDSVILANHKIFPYLAILSTAITGYLLYRTKY